MGIELFSFRISATTVLRVFVVGRISASPVIGQIGWEAAPERVRIHNATKVRWSEGALYLPTDLFGGEQFAVTDDAVTV